MISLESLEDTEHVSSLEKICNSKFDLELKLVKSNMNLIVLFAQLILKNLLTTFPLSTPLFR